MKKAALVLMMVLVCAGLVWAGNDEMVKTFKVKDGAVLEMEMHSGGSAEVTGWDRDEIEIRLTVRRTEFEDWDISFDQSGNGVGLETKVHRGINSTSLKAEVNVPHNCDISFESAGGRLQIEEVNGRFTGRTAGGQLILDKCKGEVNLRSGGGEIRVTDSELDGSMATGGGEVLVQDVVGDLTAKSGGGAVQYKNVRRKDGSVRAPGSGDVKVTSETVVISNAGGRIKVDEAPEGAVVKTGGGKVIVRGADKFVSAKTGGGDVTVALKEGWVKAVTGAGDIDVTIDKSGGDEEIVLSSGYGDISLVVDKNAKLTFEIDLGYTRESSRDFRIESDLKLELRETEDWEKSEGGNWWKHIYGTGEVNGGGQTVKIRTTNGDVRINKK